MLFECFVLGTSGMQPLVNRFLNSALVRRDGELFLFDCGEGTQVAIKKLNLHYKKINNIFISHMHADHITGLPGFLMLSSQVEREEPLHIWGPKGVDEYIEQNRRILDMYINYEIIVHTIEKNCVLIDNNDYTVRAFELDHRKQCFGYSITEKDRKGEFFPEKAIALNIPRGPLWGKLQNGESIECNGKVITSLDVCGEKRKGRKFSFVTDTTYKDDIAHYVYQSDLLLIEGMFSHTLIEDAHEKKHLTVVESATIAQDAEVKKAYFIHFSPRYIDYEIKRLEKEGREIYKNVSSAYDGLYVDIPFES